MLLRARNDAARAHERHVADGVREVPPRDSAHGVRGRRELAHAEGLARVVLHARQQHERERRAGARNLGHDVLLAQRRLARARRDAQQHVSGVEPVDARL